MRYLTSQIFTPRETPVEPSSGKASHFSWALLGTGGTQFLSGEKKCLLLFCFKKKKVFFLLIILSDQSTGAVLAGRHGLRAWISFCSGRCLDASLLVPSGGISIRNISTQDQDHNLLFPVKPAWGVGGEGESVQHAQPDH